MQILQRLKAQPASDGAGVKMHRLAGFNAASHFDPLLMLDEFNSDEPRDYLAGFPLHPHRGFETISYLKVGAMAHEDHLGHRGLVTGGGIQWMRAGRGIIHSEMPSQQDGRLHGFQLWLNLPGRLKMSAPEYRDFARSELPEFSDGHHQIKLLTGSLTMAGQLHRAPLDTGATALRYLDLGFGDGQPLALPLKRGDTALLYVYQGEVRVQGQTLGAREALLLRNGDEAEIALVGAAGSQALLLLGQPLGEPVAHYGPFVMNNREELEQAVSDYQSGRLTG
ncbi:MAG: pirin family protein [Gammaproteobacteria bacterium]|nr:pirin family protein [Gammaproteobacteria bacterium]